MDYRDNRQRWAESHQVVHFYAGQWCTFTPALTHRIKLAQNLARQANKVALMSSESANMMRENILVLWGNLNAKQ